MACKVTFVPFLCIADSVRFNLHAGTVYNISEQVLKFTENVVQPFVPGDEPPEPPRPQPIPRANFPPQRNPGGGPIIGGEQNPPHGPEGPGGGPGDPPDDPEPMPPFYGRLIAYHYLENIDRQVPSVPYPTYRGNLYLTYEVCGIECESSLVSSCCLGGAVCQDLEPSACAAVGGGIVFGKTCNQINCAVTAFGPCCLPGGYPNGCARTTEACCETLGGSVPGGWVGSIGAVCAPELCLGACCREGFDCIDTTEAICTNIGSPYVWLGQGTSCDNSCPAPRGACCLCVQYPLFSWSFCVPNMTHGNCNAMNNSDEWLPNQDCGPPSPCLGTCPPGQGGACCRFGGPDVGIGACEDGVPPGECTGPDNHYYGDGSECANWAPDGPCYRAFACCYGPFLEQCSESTFPDCQTSGGVWHEGEHCTSNPLEGGVCKKVCCYPNGICEHRSELACASLGGTYYDDEPSCSGFMCPPGEMIACCMPLQPAFCACQTMTEAQCLAAGGLALPNPPFQPGCTINGQAPIICPNSDTQCNGPCGDGAAGDCQLPQDNPGCNNELCCLCVCSYAMECCTAGFVWDDICAAYACGGALAQCDPVCCP